LKEITVDPKTVTLTQAVDPAAVKLPTVSQPMETAPASYSVNIALGAQTMKLESTNTVTDAGGVLTVTETMKTPQGDVSDSSTLDKTTLVMKSRDIKQGPMVVSLKFEGTKAIGAMGMGTGAPPQEIDVDAGGPMFADGPASFRSLAALPLKDGYTITFRNFDVQKRKSSLKRAMVSPIEDVTVPAGTFKAWKVEVKSADGEPGEQKVWIDSVTRRIVKIWATLPEMGGAIATIELTK
jgi:hypothetical protein